MSFGPFHVLPSQQLLLEEDRSLRLGRRAFDIMVALVERAGQLVSKDEMRNLVWPGPSSKMAISKSRLRASDGHSGMARTASQSARTREEKSGVRSAFFTNIIFPLDVRRGME